jgi:hypothetical protein
MISHKNDSSISAQYTLSTIRDIARELVHNSIDANSKRINVKIDFKNWNLKVEDDGSRPFSSLELIGNYHLSHSQKHVNSCSGTRSRTGLDLSGTRSRTGLDLSGTRSRTGLDLSGACSRTGLDLSGTCSRTGLDLSGTCSRTGLDLSGACSRTGLDLSGTCSRTGLDLTATCSSIHGNSTHDDGNGTHDDGNSSTHENNRKSIYGFRGRSLFLTGQICSELKIYTKLRKEFVLKTIKV